jgi:hypothetical protein
MVTRGQTLQYRTSLLSYLLERERTGENLAGTTEVCLRRGRGLLQWSWKENDGEIIIISLQYLRSVYLEKENVSNWEVAESSTGKCLCTGGRMTTSRLQQKCLKPVLTTYAVVVNDSISVNLNIRVLIRHTYLRLESLTMPNSERDKRQKKGGKGNEAWLFPARLSG